MATSASAQAAKAGALIRQAGVASSSRHVGRQILDNIRIGFSKQVFLQAPPEITERFRGRAVRARFVQDAEHLVLCLQPTDKSGPRFGETVRAGKRMLLLNPKNVDGGVTDKWPSRFASTSPQSAIWGEDGILRFHLPKNLTPPSGIFGRKKEARGGEQQKPRSEKAAPRQDRGKVLDSLPVVPASEKPTPPRNSPPPGAPILTGEVARKMSVGYSTSLRIHVAPEIVEWWSRQGVSARAEILDDRPVITFFRDPTSRNSWSERQPDGSHCVQIKPELVDGIRAVPKFRKTSPSLMSWDGDEIVLKFPHTRDLRQPKKSVSVLLAKTPPAEAQPRTELTTQDRLRAAIRALNEIKAEMGEGLTLSIKEDGGVKALVMQEFE